MQLKDCIYDVAKLEGRQIPCLYVENKIDLLTEEYIENSDELEEFARNNGFFGAFKVSAKTGFNVNESMEYLLKIVIEIIEKMNEKKKEKLSILNKYFNY